MSVSTMDSVWGPAPPGQGPAQLPADSPRERLRKHFGRASNPGFGDLDPSCPTCCPPSGPQTLCLHVCEDGRPPLHIGVDSENQARPRTPRCSREPRGPCPLLRETRTRRSWRRLYCPQPVPRGPGPLRVPPGPRVQASSWSPSIHMRLDGEGSQEAARRCPQRQLDSRCLLSGAGPCGADVTQLPSPAQPPLAPPGRAQLCEDTQRTLCVHGSSLRPHVTLRPRQRCELYQEAMCVHGPNIPAQHWLK